MSYISPQANRRTADWLPLPALFFGHFTPKSLRLTRTFSPLISDTPFLAADFDHSSGWLKILTNLVGSSSAHSLRSFCSAISSDKSFCPALL